MIFNVIIDWIIKSADAPIFKVTVYSYIVDLAYSDEIVLLSENEEDAQRFLKAISIAAARPGLFTSIPKTKAVFFNCSTPTTILGNNNIENVEAFTNLGSKNNTTTCSDEVTARIGKIFLPLTASENNCGGEMK